MQHRKILDKHSHRRQRRVQKRHDEKLRAEIKLKLSRSLAKSPRPSSARMGAISIPVLQPRPVRAVDQRMQFHSTPPVPIVCRQAQQGTPDSMASFYTANTDPMASFRTANTNSMASFYTVNTAVGFPHSLPSPAPSLMDARSASAMIIEDNNHAFADHMQPPTSHFQLPATPAPSTMSFRTASAMLVQDYDRNTPAQDNSVDPLHHEFQSGRRGVLPLQERYDLLRRFFQQLHRDMGTEMYYAAMDTGYA